MVPCSVPNPSLQSGSLGLHHSLLTASSHKKRHLPAEERERVHEAYRQPAHMRSGEHRDPHTIPHKVLFLVFFDVMTADRFT